MLTLIKNLINFLSIPTNDKPKHVVTRLAHRLSCFHLIKLGVIICFGFVPLFLRLNPVDVLKYVLSTLKNVLSP